MKVTDKTALITGAGSGIGRGIALALAKRGCHLALADINPEGLAETHAVLNPSGIRVSQHLLDVRDKAAIQALPAAMEEAHGSIDLLINNAGVAAGGEFGRVSEETFDWLMDINFHAVVRLTRVFLPHLQQRPEAHIVNLSSLYGLIAPAEQTAYSASKFAVRGFSNALRHELKDSPIGITVVHPGGVATNIAKNARIPEDTPEAEIEERQRKMAKLLRMPPERAGELIVRGIEQKKARILVGTDAKILALLERILPVDYWKVVKMLSDMKGR